MKNKQFIRYCWLTALLIIIPCACRKAAVHKNIICFIDFSNEPLFPGRVNYYAGIAATEIIAQMSYGDRIVILPVDNGTLTNSGELIDFTFKNEGDYIPDGTSPLDEDGVAEKNLNSDKKHFIAMLNRSVASALIERRNLKEGTDILSALSSAAKYEQNGQDNRLVFLSDMMNWSADLKMEPGHFSSAMIDAKLAAMPNINGKHVEVLVHTGDETGISNAHFMAVNQFWVRYFKANNFDLTDYSSTSDQGLRALFSVR